MSKVELYHGDCLDILPTLPAESVDAVITDPPYPCIKRSYGYWTVAEWWEMVVEGVVPEVRRILKPSGSAVFILQPNSEHVGQMRGWLWEFMAWVCREWNMVQDAYWWNITAFPTVGATQYGLMRSSIKNCIWCGGRECYRSQEDVLWEESFNSRYRRTVRRAAPELYNRKRVTPSGQSSNLYTMHDAAERRGGVTPYNLLPLPNNGPKCVGSISGHGAGTPLKLADWWTRYICPPGGVVCDPFMGSGTMGVAAVNNGCDFVGIERVPEYVDIAKQRIAEAQAEPRQLEML